METQIESAAKFEKQMVNVEENGTSNSEGVMSKRALKRKAKQEKWEMNKKAMRAKEKQRKKLKRIALREKGFPSGKPPSRKELKGAMANSSCRQRVAIDIGFDNLMTDRDISKTCKQIQRCYALNRRSKSPLQLYITSCNGKTKDKLFATQGTEHWDIHFKPNSWIDEFSKNDVVYLTSDSDCVLENLDDSKVYIIGGLVDHNKHKRVCFNQAQENDVKHARLPIDEFIDMKTRKTLTINHVFDIIIKVLNGETWKDAFMSTIASRKGAVPKDEIETDNEDDDNGCNLSTDEKRDC
ncbi:hypothetical protein CHUAL_002619 [Chamberlinius hualienensis]